MNQNPFRHSDKSSPNINHRLSVWYGILIIISLIFIVRLFYLQVVQHDYYKAQALNDQLREYAIVADRGIINAHQGTDLVPIVLNEKLYTLYADPQFIKNALSTAEKVATVTGGDPQHYADLMKTPKSRYAVLAKRVPEAQKKQIMALKLPGVALQAQLYRTYPQGTLAAQLLGFVNGEGKGTYGIEQALDKDLAGIPGRLKAVTDARGVPLVASKNNIQIDPKSGNDVTLTIDLAMQKELENHLKAGLEHAKSKSGSAIIMDPYTGAVKAMANFPTYDPAQYFNVKDASLFVNAAVARPIEVGSSMKVLTTSAALDQGVIKPDTIYDDPGQWTINGHVIKNVEESAGSGKRSISQLLNLSLNTGATWLLMQMGGGKINQQARDRWHDYMVNRYQLGKITGIEQGYEAAGNIPSPNEGFALDLTYANTAFGQAMTATPLQMAGALSAVLNGGTYYQPRLVDAYVDSTGKKIVKNPKIIRKNVVSTQTSKDIQPLMEYVVKNHTFNPKFPPNYLVGGKTGTAQIANPAGGYYEDKFNGTYIGFVGGDKPEYVIVVEADTPGIGGYAGSVAAQPIFGRLVHMLISNFNVPPKAGG